MAATLVLEETRTLLRNVIRTIDKNADFSVSLQEGNQPGVAVALSLRGHKTSLSIPSDKIAAASNLIGRNELRTKLKRALDLIAFTPSTITSTKMLRGTVIEGGFFRTQNNSRGRR